MIKAIETVYKGYKFRSRLEARWAVFFETLGIEWQYEPEGFDLGEGVWYLPDFYLVHPECWIEIKPEAPSIEEQEKAGLLAAYSKKFVNIFCGNPYPNEYEIWSFRHKFPNDNYTRALNRAIEEKDDFLFRTILASNHHIYFEDFKREAIENGFEHIWVDRYARPYHIVKNGVACYCPYHRTLSFGHKIFRDEFSQCVHCGEVHQCNNFATFLGVYGRCFDCDTEDTEFCEPDEVSENEFLTKAYTAARQARFEHGQNGII